MRYGFTSSTPSLACCPACRGRPLSTSGLCWNRAHSGGRMGGCCICRWKATCSAITSASKTRKEKFTLLSNHDGSLLRQQPGKLSVQDKAPASQSVQAAASLKGWCMSGVTATQVPQHVRKISWNLHRTDPACRPDNTRRRCEGTCCSIAHAIIQHAASAHGP